MLWRSVVAKRKFASRQAHAIKLHNTFYKSKFIHSKGLIFSSGFPVKEANDGDREKEDTISCGIDTFGSDANANSFVAALNGNSKK